MPTYLCVGGPLDGKLVELTDNRHYEFNPPTKEQEASARDGGLKQYNYVRARYYLYGHPVLKYSAEGAQDDWSDIV